MFKHIVALNTYTEPFLNLRANDQRNIIEQLLGITLLSEKADSLKEQNKITRESIQTEEIKIAAIIDANKRIQDQIDSLERRQTLWNKKHQEDVSSLQVAYNQLAELDIEQELAAHKSLLEYNTKSTQLETVKQNLTKNRSSLSKVQKEITRLEKELNGLINHTCHACGQEYHDQNHDTVLQSKNADLDAAKTEKIQIETEINENETFISNFQILESKPETFYTVEQDAFEHKNSMSHLWSQLQSKINEVDPYSDQIKEMKEQALQVVNYDTINELTNLREHQDFLLKLLTNKDSFIRKKIIDQNLAHLNTRLAYYLDKIGLPHTVKFNNDLTVSIEELGRELDFDNLSRGERNRLILSLSWAFRDVWESLYQQINLLFIDELVDSGMDSSGVENSLAILKKMSREGSRSVWLVSHKDELASRVNNILTVVKENGFTSYNTDVEVI